MVKEGLFLSVLMLLSTLISIGFTLLILDYNFSETSILKMAVYGVPATLMMLAPIGGGGTNRYWKLLGLSLFTYMIGNVSSIVIIYLILFLRFLLEGIACYGFYQKDQPTNKKKD